MNPPLGNAADTDNNGTTLQHQRQQPRVRHRHTTQKHAQKQHQTQQKQKFPRLPQQKQQQPLPKQKKKRVWRKKVVQPQGQAQELEVQHEDTTVTLTAAPVPTTAVTTTKITETTTTAATTPTIATPVVAAKVTPTTTAATLATVATVATAATTATVTAVTLITDAATIENAVERAQNKLKTVTTRTHPPAPYVPRLPPSVLPPRYHNGNNNAIPPEVMEWWTIRHRVPLLGIHGKEEQTEEDTHTARRLDYDEIPTLHDIPSAASLHHLEQRFGSIQPNSRNASEQLSSALKECLQGDISLCTNISPEHVWVGAKPKAIFFFQCPSKRLWETPGAHPFFDSSTICQLREWLAVALPSFSWDDVIIVDLFPFLKSKPNLEKALLTSEPMKKFVRLWMCTIFRIFPSISKTLLFGKTWKDLLPKEFHTTVTVVDHPGHVRTGDNNLKVGAMWYDALKDTFPVSPVYVEKLKQAQRPEFNKVTKHLTKVKHPPREPVPQRPPPTIQPGGFHTPPRQNNPRYVYSTEARSTSYHYNRQPPCPGLNNSSSSNLEYDNSYPSGRKICRHCKKHQQHTV